MTGWLIGLLIWTAVAIVVGMLIGRSIRRADEHAARGLGCIDCLEKALVDG